MASKRPISQEDGTSPRPLKRSQPCHHCCREAMENLVLEMEQRIFSEMEQRIGRRIHEEVKSILMLLNNSSATPLSPRPISNPISEVPRFRLHFDNELPHILFTYQKIEAVDCVPLRLTVRDARSNEIVSYGPFSTLKTRVVVLDGKFCSDGQEWTKDEFIKAMMPQRKDKRPLLIGALEFSLSNGVSEAIQAQFTDNSSWSLDGFRLAAMVYDDISLHERVLEAISGAFKVKDCRVKQNQKVDPPLLNDKVWRLRNIGRNGPLHRRLADANIDTVQDFLRSLTMHPDLLRNLLERPQNFWDRIVGHARESTLGSKQYSYHIEEKGIVLVFNSIFELVGANIDSGLCRPLSALSRSEKELVENFKSVAYKDFKNMDEFDGTLVDTTVLRSSVADPQIYDHSLTFPDDSITMIGQQNTPLPQSQYGSTEHGFDSHQSSSFQMPHGTQALGGTIDSNVSVSTPRYPAASSSPPGSGSLLIPTYPSRQSDLQCHPESVCNKPPSDLYNNISVGESFHYAQQSVSDPIFSDDEITYLSMLAVSDHEAGPSSMPFSVKWSKLIAVARWVLAVRKLVAKRAKIMHLSKQIQVPNAQASACGS